MDDFLARFARDVGKNLRAAKRNFDRAIGKTEHPQILSYRGYGNDARMLIMGRALRDPGLTEASETDHWTKNLVNSYKRMETDELPGATVRARIGSIVHNMIADDEGFFRAVVELSTPIPPDSGNWHNVPLELIDPVVLAGQPTAIAPVLVPPRDSDFGIISDLDDTVIQTGATNLIRMIKATMLGNARTRVPFAGVAAFYAALQQGPSGTSYNPIFYVSSSPWNLYDVLEQFFALHRIPTGPTLLRDWGMSLERLPIGHAAHKTASIKNIFEMYPQTRFILIGDSGQHDPEIYRDLAREYPGRILAAYIRDVTPGMPRGAALKRITDELGEMGCKMVVAADTVAAARDAAAAGWISENTLSDVAEEKKRDAQQS